MNPWLERRLGRWLKNIHAGEGGLVLNDPRFATVPNVIALTSPAFVPSKTSVEEGLSRRKAASPCASGRASRATSAIVDPVLSWAMVRIAMCFRFSLCVRDSPSTSRRSSMRFLWPWERKVLGCGSLTGLYERA